MNKYKKHFTLIAIISTAFLSTACQEKLSFEEHTKKYGYDGQNIKPIYPDYVKDVPIEDWRLTAGGRYAHSLKYEHLLNKPVPYKFDSSRDYGLEKEKYFEHLCKTEGKDYIFETTQEVDTIAVLRNIESPPNPPGKNFTPDDYLRNMYSLEAPLIYDEHYDNAVYSEYDSERQWKGRDELRIQNNIPDFGLLERHAFAFYGYFGGNYKNVQVLFNNAKVLEYTQDEEKSKLKGGFYVKGKRIDKVSAKYGITWRGFQRERDREHGLAGSDLIIVNLETGKIAAIQRNFMRGSMYPKREGLYWWGSACPESYKAIRNGNLIKIIDEKGLADKSFALQELLLRRDSMFIAYLIHRPFIQTVLKQKK